MKGKLHRLSLESKCLRENRAREPARRPLYVYTPPEVESSPTSLFPVLYVLAPWTAAGRQQFDWKPFKESLPERLERLVDAKKMTPAIVVAPDLYTRFGGSQYVNSTFFGPHGDHIVEEVIPYIEKHFPALRGKDHRGVFGRSSGGFGALRLARDYPDRFGALACHSGDLGFELLFGGDLHTFPRLLAKYNGAVDLFLDYAFSAPKLSGAEIHLLMLLGSAGFYSPNDKSPMGFDLPIDLYSGKIQREVWQKWLQQDPLSIFQDENEATKISHLKLIYLECGRFDQYHLLYGARQLHETFVNHKVKHFYEEFDDNHSGTDYRFDLSIPQMVKALTE